MVDKLTIALPVYKRTDFFRSALNSAVNQTVKCKILVIDNHSPHDEFKKIVDAYNNPLIKYIKTESTVPQDENFNNCFRYADTPWITILHDDDMVHCQLAEFAKAILDKYPDKVNGIACNSYVGQDEWDGIKQLTQLTKDIKILKPGFFYFSNLVFPGIILRRDIALKLGGFNINLHPIADFDLWYRYTKETTFVLVNQNLGFYRVSPAQSTNVLINDMINNVFQYRRQLTRKGIYANPLTRLTIGQSLIENITHFTNHYPEIKFTLKPELERNYVLAKKLQHFGLLQKILNRYCKWLSYSKLK